VSEVEYSGLQERMHVPNDIESWVHDRILEWRETSPRRSLLLVLSGNAGDGKSDLIARLLKDLGDAGDLDVIPDATHADSPREDQVGRLIEFFTPFADGAEPPAEPVISLIAMNTGMALSFLQEATKRDASISFKQLGAVIRRELGLSGDGQEPSWEYEIVNLDRRGVLSFDGSPALFDGMLDRIDPENEDGVLWDAAQRCSGCEARASCFVRTNVEMLRLPEVRANLTDVLWGAALAGEIHLSPRNLWDFLYQVTTSGTEFFAADDSPCETIDRLQQDPAAGAPEVQRRLLYNLVFEPTGEGERGPVLQAAGEADPVLHVRRNGHAIEGEVFNDPASDADSLRTAAEVVGSASPTSEPDPCLQRLAGQLELGEWERADRLALGRGAVRRARIVGVPGNVGDEVADQEVRDFGNLLTSYARWKNGPPPEDVRKFATDTVAAVNRIFGAAETGDPYFRQDTFSPASNFPLFAPVNLAEAIEPVPDADTVRSPGWLAAANYRPTYIAVDVRTGGESPARIRATLALYRLFQRVLSGYAASSVDLEAFFGLRYACERLGNSSEARELRIRDVKEGTLYRLREQSLFGTTTLEFEEVTS